ncbi:MAG: selenocysteine-specific translation elongation factor [Burkholderiales bacterium]
MIIGTAGHIDHGKTSLVKALTGVDGDRLRQEKERGITIDLGYAYAPLPNGEVLGFVDVPGHQKFIHNMLAGITGIDFFLLAIAADDGIMPQTLEHVQILQLLGIHKGIVALTKVDRVADERLETVRREIGNLLADHNLSSSDIFPVSSANGFGIDALRARLITEALALPDRSAAGLFRLAIDRCFSLTGVGTIVTGTIFSGTVSEGDKLLLSPGGIPLRVRGLHVQNRPAPTGSTGQRCALNVTGPEFDKRAVQRGDWVLAESLHAPVTRLDVRLDMLPGSGKPLRHWSPIHVHLGAVTVTGHISILEGDRVAPGDSALAQLVLDKAVGALRGDRFIVRDASAVQTLAGGSVLDIYPPARGQRSAARLQALRALESATPEQALTGLLDDNLAGIDLHRFARNWNLDVSAANNLWIQLGLHTVGKSHLLWGFLPQAWTKLAKRITDTLAEEHIRAPDMPGIDRARLRRIAAPKLEPAIFMTVVEELLATDRIKTSGHWLHLPSHSVMLLAQEKKLWNSIRPLLSVSPNQPPRVRDIARALNVEENPVRGLLYRLAQSGELFQVAHDHFFTSSSIANLAAIARQLAEQDQLNAATFRDHIEVGRKLAIQILEFFDRIGYTRRIRDTHKLRQTDLLTARVAVS